MKKRALFLFRGLILIAGFVFLLAGAFIGAGCSRSARRYVSPPDQKATSDDLLARAQAADHFAKGDLFEKSGNLDRAAEEYRLALVFDPGSDELKRNLARIYYMQQRFDEALDLYLRLSRMTNDDVLMTGECYRQAGDEKNAFRYFKMAFDLDSTSEAANMFLKSYYAARGELKRAEYHMRCLLAGQEGTPRWSYDMGMFYIETKQLGRAGSLFEELVKSYPADNRGYFGLAAIREMQGDQQAADSVYRLIARKNWDDPSMLLIISQSLIRLDDLEFATEVTRRICELFPSDYLTARRLGLLYFAQKDLRRADSVFAALVDAVSDDAVTHYYRGRIAEADSDFAAAQWRYTLALALEDTLTEAWLGLASARLGLGDTAGATSTLDTAIAKSASDSLEVIFMVGVFYSEHRLYQRAIDSFARVLQSRPRDPKALFGLGSSYERVKEFDKAEEVFTALLKIQPDNHMALNYLGFMLADRGQKLDYAEKLIKRALKFEPDNGAYLDSYAWVLYKKGRYKEALEYQMKAIRNSAEDDAVLFDHLGDIYAALKQSGKAKENWQRALELDPQNETIRQKLAK